MMEGSMMGSGWAIKCMGKECLSGQMEGFIVEIMNMMRKMELGCFSGRMEAYIKGFGWGGINMEGGSSLGRMGVLERETGGMGSLKVKL